MMEGFLLMEDGDQLIPFVRCFCGSPSTVEAPEIVFACLDDVYAACGPLRVPSVHTSVEEEFFTHANMGGVMPEGVEELTQAARRVKDVVVWKGDLELPLAQQGLKVLEIPGINDLQAACLFLMM